MPNLSTGDAVALSEKGRDLSSIIVVFLVVGTVGKLLAVFWRTAGKLNSTISANVLDLEPEAVFS